MASYGFNPGAGIEEVAALGNQSRVAAETERRQHKQQLSDEERQLKATDLINTRNAILTKLPTLQGPNGEKTPEYDQAYQALTQTQQDLGQLYHPDKAPGALQQDWHWLLGKMHGIASPKDKAATPTTPATAQPAAPTVPQGATPTMAVAKPKGLVEAGNIPIWNRPSVLNDDGTHSSELSISIGDDKGNQILIPLIVDGKFLTPDGKMPTGPVPHNAQEWEKASPEWKALKMRAQQHYEKTGQHLGKFGGDTAEDDVDAYAQVLHNRGSATAQAAQTAPAAPAKPPTWGQAQLLKKQAASLQQAQKEASTLAAGVPLTDVQKALAEIPANESLKAAQIDSTLRIAKRLGLSDNATDELKQQLAGLKNIVPKPLTGAAGVPYKGPDGLYRQNVTNPDGTVGWRQMPPDWKPQTKAVRGTLVNSKEHGFIQTWVDPYNPSKITGWQKITPSRYYQGTTTTKSSTDSVGVITTSSGTTMPANSTPVSIDLSGTQELPSDFNGGDMPSAREGQSTPPEDAITSTTPPSGSPNKKPMPGPKPPASVATATAGTSGETPATLRTKVPSTPISSPEVRQVDAQGHIPDVDIHRYGINPNLAQIANNILDGADITKIAFKDRGAAEGLAKQYGWRGQGLFTPRETLQLKEGASFLNMMANSPALKVLDNGFFSNIPMMGASPDPIKEGFFGRLATNLSSRQQSPDQQKFMDLYRQLDAMAVGLRALVQAGRGTQKQTDLLISELPNPYNTPSSADARRRLQLVQKELDIAAKTGNLPSIEDMQEDFNATKDSEGSLSLDDFQKKYEIGKYAKKR